MATLTSTTFAQPVATADTDVQVLSTSGLVPGICLFSGRELMRVLRLTGIGNGVKVLRGQDGTRTSRHAVTETVYIGRGDQFFAVDPEGVPPTAPTVTPVINILTGDVWVVQGDQVGAGAGAQTWQKVTSSQSRGALGVRVDTTTTPS